MRSDSIWLKHQVLLAWGLLVLVVLAGLFWVVLPLLQKMWQLDGQIEDGYRQLQRFQQIAAATPELMQEYERVKQQGLDKLFYPHGMTAAQVAKELQNQVATVVAQGGGTLVSSEVMETPTGQGVGAYQQVAVKAVFQGSPALLRDVLHQAYQARPLLFVEQLDLKPLEGNQGQQVLKAEVQVSTYWRGGELNDEQTTTTP